MPDEPDSASKAVGAEAWAGARAALPAIRSVRTDGSAVVSHRYTLLIGDDDVAVRQCLSEMLAARGYDVLTACTGSESLRILFSRPVDLTILDIHMPDMTGLEVFERYVRGPFVAGPGAAASRVPGGRAAAIFMSADATQEIRDRAARVGSPLIDKPFEPAAMRAAVEDALARRPND